MKKYVCSLFFTFCTFLILSNFASAYENLATTKGHFVENEGVYADQNIDYFSQTNFGSVFVEKNAICYQFVKNKATLNQQKLTEGEAELKELTFDVLNIKQLFINANFGNPIALNNQISFTNYFIGNEPKKWNTNLKNYDGLLFQNIYPNIDLKYYSSGNKIKYDYVLHPGSNISDIKIKYEGIKGITPQSKGSVIIISTEYGEFYESMPEVFQIIEGHKNKLNCNYVLNNNIVTYKIENYNPNLDIIIDPTLTYASYFGGAADDYFTIGDIAEDNLGNLYATGTTSSTNFPTTPGAYSSIFAGLPTDIFVMKFDPNGILIASTFIGGNDYDFGFGIDVDVNGNIVVGGDAWSGNFPTTAGTYQPIHSVVSSTNGDVTVTRLNQSLSQILTSTFIGGNNDEQAHEIIAGSNGNIYIGGQAKSGLPTTAGCYQASNSGDYDYFASILSSNFSSLIASTYVGASARDRGNGIAIDNNFNVYLTGYVEGAFPTTPGAFDVTFGGASDVTVVKLNPSLSNLIYSTYLGGSGADLAQSSIEVVNNEAIIVGTAGNSNFPTTAGSYSTSSSGGSDIFVSKLNSAGSGLICSTFIGSSGADEGWNVYIGANGNIGVTGGCSNSFPITNCAYDNSYNGGATDAFLSIFNSNCSSLIYSTYYGGSGNDIGRALYLGGTKQIIFGNTYSANLDLSANAFDVSYGGGGLRDLFVAILDGSTYNSSFTFDSVCVNTPVSFTAEVGTTSASWNFGDVGSGANNTSNLLNPTHQFTTAGNYTITLIASNSCLTDTISQIINLSAPSVTTAIADTTVCPNTNLLLIAVGGTDYTWNNGITSTNDSVTVNINANMQFVVFAQNASCPSIADTINVSIASSTTAFIVGDSIMCAGDSLMLIANGNANSYQWSGAVASVNDTIIITPLNSTTLYLQGSGSTCNSLVDTINISVTNNVSAFFAIGSALCANSAINFNFTGANATNYYWNFGDSLNNISYYSFQQNPLHTFNNSGTYIINLIAQNNCGTDTISQPISIIMGPFANLPNDSTICAGQTITLASNGGTAYNWGGAMVSTNDSIIVSPLVNSIYTLTVSNGVCYGLPDTVLISVEFPNLVQIIGDNNLYCPGDSVKLYGNGANNITWDVFGISHTQNPIEIAANSSGMVYASTNNAVCPASTDSFYVNVANRSQANFALNIDSCLNIITLVNRSMGASTYKWQVIDIMESELKSPQFEVNQSMEYEIMLITNPNSNCADSITQKIFLRDNYGNNFFIPNVFTPNGDGLNDEFIIGTWNNCKYFKLYIYNRWGNKILFTEGYKVKWNGKYEGIDLPTGVYVYILESGETEKTGTITLYR